MIDIDITGSMGLYTIDALTSKARKWCRKHLPGAIHLSGSIVCEGGRECREIVAGMVANGLRVEVNGVDMRGFA